MSGKAVTLWLLTLLFWGSSPLLEKLALKAVSPLLALTIRTSVAALALILAVLFSGAAAEISAVTARDVFILAASGILAGFLGMFTYFSLLKTGEASRIVPLTAAYPLVTALLALVLLREHLTPLRLFGILLTISGLIILQRS